MLPPTLTAQGSPEVTDTRSSPDPRPVFYQQPAELYCNGTLVGITDQLMQRLQAVQNAAAHLIVGARWFDSVSRILCDLHWLPVRQRITFKLCVLAYECLHSMSHHTCPSFMCRHRRKPAVHGCARLRRFHSSCHALAHATETGTSL